MDSKKTISNSFLDLKSNLEHWAVDFPAKNEMTFLRFHLLLGFSVLLCCVGINFENNILVYLGILISPFTTSFILFSIALYGRRTEMVLRSIYRIAIGSVLILLFSWIYFHYTPFSWHPQYLEEFAELNVSNYIAIVLLAVSIGLYAKFGDNLIVWALCITMKWNLLLMLAGVCVGTHNWEMLLLVVTQFALAVCLIFVGVYFTLRVFKIAKLEFVNNFQKMAMLSLNLLMLGFAIAVGGRECYRMTTEYNVNQYLNTELASKSFVINNYTLDKNTKEIVVYYTGSRPTAAQDERLKSNYHLESYHLEFQEIK